MAQGKVATLPMSWHRVGWLGMAALMVAGYEMWLVLGKRKGEDRKRFSKSFFFLASAHVEEGGEQCRSKTTPFLFFLTV